MNLFEKLSLEHSKWKIVIDSNIFQFLMREYNDNACTWTRNTESKETFPLC